MRRLLSIAALCLLALPASAAWYNANWPFRIKLTVDATYVDEDTGYAFFDMSDFGTDFWTNVQGEGDSRATTSDETTECAIHIIGFSDNGTTGQGWMRVALTTSTSADTDVYVYYGNSGASLPSAGDTYGSQNAYDSNIIAAYIGDATDQTSNGNDLSQSGTPTSETGPFTGIPARGYSGGAHDYLSSSPITAQPVTVMGWAYTTDNSALQTIAGIGATGDYCSAQIRFSGHVGGDPVSCYVSGAFGSNSQASTSTGYTTTTWHHVALTRTGTTGTSTVYIDGGSTGTDSTTILDLTTANRFSIGARYLNSASSAYPLSGRTSLIELHDMARSGNYIATARNYAVSQSSMVTVGTQESAPASGQTGFVEFASVSTSALGGIVNWTNATNMLTSLASAATADVPDSEYTYVADVVNPSANISGLLTYVTRIDIRVTATGEDGTLQELYDDTVQLIVGGSTYGANKAEATQWTDTAQVAKTYTWSLANGDTMPTAAQVDATDFGVRLRYYSSGGDTALMSVYLVEVDVYSSDDTTSSSNFFFAG